MMIVQTDIPVNPKHEHIKGSNDLEQGILVPEQKMIDQNDLNDDHCFKCGKKGEVYCCDRCFRSFHKACITTKRFSKVWSCEYCNNRHLCVTCQAPSNDLDPLLICTLCFRFVHSTCSNVPEDILSSQNHFFRGKDNFVCKCCLKQFGFKYVLSESRKTDQDDSSFYFVNLNTRSPIHCGWFDEAALRDAPRELEQGSLKEIEVFQVPAIDKVIRMKAPHSIREEELDQTINMLLMGTYEPDKWCYGSENNFYFLVVWEGGDYTGATWEDQHIILKDCISTCPQLVKYLLYRKLELALKDKKSLASIYELFSKHFPVQPQPKWKDNNLGQLFKHLKESSAEVNYLIPSDNFSQTVEFVCTYLSSLYTNDLAKNPTLFVCSGPVPRWQRRLRQMCYQLNIVALKGSQLHIIQVKQKDLTYQWLIHPKFQVMLLPEERWNKQKKFIMSKQFNFSVIIFDENVADSLLDQFDFEPPFQCDKKIYFIDREIGQNSQLTRHKTKQYIQIDIEEQALVYDLGQSKVLTPEFIPLDKPINPLQQLQNHNKNTHEQYQASSRWKQLERIIFLQFVLSYGYNSPSTEMFSKLISFCRGIFAGDDRDLRQFYNYSKRFLAALNSYRLNEGHHTYYKFYFFDLQGSSIFKRIVKLQKLKTILEGCKSRPQAFPRIGDFIIFKDDQAMPVYGWDFRQDFILVALILSKGFGRWLQISRTKDWFKFASSCHFASIKQFKLYQGIQYFRYLYKLLNESPSNRNNQLLKKVRTEDLLKERGQILLQAIDK